MEFLGDAWLRFVVGPLTEGLTQLMILTGSAVLGIIVFTIITRVVLLPLSVMQIRSQKKMLALQPELKALQKRFAKDPEKKMQEQMRLYKENGVNPALGCLPLALQMPILFGLYAALSNLAHSYVEPYTTWVKQSITQEQLDIVAPMLHAKFLYLPCGLAGPDGIPLSDVCNQANPLDPTQFLMIPGLAIHVPGPMLIVMTILSFLVQRMMVMPSTDPQQQQMNKMMAFMPLMYLFFFSSVPAGLVVYWLTTNLVSIIQQYVIAGPGSMNLPWSKAEPPILVTTNGLVDKTAAINEDGTDDERPERPPERRAATRSAARRRKSGRR